MSQHLRNLAQDRQSVHHLVVVVHQVLLAQPSVVALIDLPDIDLTVRIPKRAPLDASQLPDLLLGQHLVLDIGDQRPNIAKVRLRRPGLLHLLVNLRQNTGRLLLIRYQLKCFLSQHSAVIADDLGADPVNGPKLQPRGQFLAKKARKPAGHIARSGNCISHSENILGIDPAVRDHVAQTQDQHRGLSAPRHSQQKHRPVHRLHGLRLLRIEHDSIAGTFSPGLRIPVRHRPSFFLPPASADALRYTQRLSTASGFMSNHIILFSAIFSHLVPGFP